MARCNRGLVFSPDEIAVVHVMNRTTRRCWLFGDDPLTGKNYDHRKAWCEERLKLLASQFGIDLISFTILDNHYHMVLRSRPDVVATWDDTEVARRWLTLCPKRKDDQGRAEEPTTAELNSIRKDKKQLREIRTRLSHISWWVRLFSQKIAQRANLEEKETGKFFQARFKATRLIDETSILACAAYVDLNPIRAAIAETLEMSHFTSIQRRVQDLKAGHAKRRGGKASEAPAEQQFRSGFLSPVDLNEHAGEIGPCAHEGGRRCSDKGFLPMSAAAYAELLDWTARQVRADKRGATRESGSTV